MKVRIALFALLISGLSTTNLHAFSSLAKYIKEGYKNEEEYKPFMATYTALETKCDVCHKPGADKKAKGHGLNDFGKVYHDRFQHKEFTAADKEKKTEEAMKLFKDAWEKSVKEKNAEGKEFLELIKEGKLPGKND